MLKPFAQLVKGDLFKIGTQVLKVKKIRTTVISVYLIDEQLKLIPYLNGHKTWLLSEKTYNEKAESFSVVKANITTSLSCTTTYKGIKIQLFRYVKEGRKKVHFYPLVNGKRINNTGYGVRDEAERLAKHYIDWLIIQSITA